MTNATLSQIRSLDDATALRLLKTITTAHAPTPPTLDPTLAPALASELSAPTPTPADGDAARLALELLADDPRYAGPLEMLVHSPSPHAFAIEPITGLLLGGALLFALQTHIQIEKDKAGKWTIKILRKPTNTSLLAPLIKKLLSLLGG